MTGQAWRLSYWGRLEPESLQEFTPMPTARYLWGLFKPTTRGSCRTARVVVGPVNVGVLSLFKCFFYKPTLPAVYKLQTPCMSINHEFYCKPTSKCISMH